MGKLKDLSGRKFGRLTVTDEHYRYEKPCGSSIVKWKCKCDCGNVIDVTSTSLTSGKTISCGCWKKEILAQRAKEKIRDLSNEKFGRLTVLNMAEPKNGRTMWHCKCECGNELDIQTTSLTSGNTKSCGCYQRDMASIFATAKRQQNEYIFYDDYVIGKLFNGEYFKIDKDDYDKVKDYYWSITPKGYVYTSYYNDLYFIHRFITDCPDDKKVDHINRDKKDNRRCNLRICTQKENCYNRMRENKNKYKGVVKLDKKYGASVHKDGTTYYLGRFNTPEEAALAYNEKAKELFGEFACLNNIPCQEQGATEDVVT